ncbi:MAG: tetratricopeptide repeat protein [Planctomycetota bacterium]|nr:tetratricopeptide repeat protein [Planctomycetota bacterium]
MSENYQRGVEAIKKGDFKQAIEILSAERGSSPLYQRAQADLADLLMNLERYQEAEAMARRAWEYIKTNGCTNPPLCVRIMRRLAESISSQGRREEAVDVFEEAVRFAGFLSEESPQLSREIELEQAHTLNSWAVSYIERERFSSAEEALRLAVVIYEKFRNENRVGHAEALTNLANVMGQTKRGPEAELLLVEAIRIAQRDDNSLQVRRIQAALIGMGSKRIPKDEAYALLDEGTEEALSAGLHSTAFVRQCILATTAARNGDVGIGLAAVSKCLEIEPEVDTENPNLPRLRIVHAGLLRDQGAEDSEVLSVLIEGASLWYLRLPKLKKSEDYLALTETLHDHFRMLSKVLLDQDRVEEALVAFEAGRGLGHAVQVDETITDRVLASNPFRVASDEVRCEILRSWQEALRDDEVIVVICVIPPNLVTFVVGVDGVECRQAAYPSKGGGIEALENRIRAIPDRLVKGKGVRAIPKPVLEMAQVIKEMVGPKTIRTIAPYAWLHLVPWRVILKNEGLPWSQLRCVIHFGLIAGRETSAEGDLVEDACVTMGHGTAGERSREVDLRDEARDFAAAFGEKGKYEERCTAAELKRALSTKAIVLLSCHASWRETRRGGDLTLVLEDGDVFLNTVLPQNIASPLVILSTCDSGIYRMGWGDYPVGALPEIIRRGAPVCIGARFLVRAEYARDFMSILSRRIAAGERATHAFCDSLAEAEAGGWGLWRDLACLEILEGW